MASHVVHQLAWDEVFKRLSIPMQEKYHEAWQLFKMLAQGHDLFYPYLYYQKNHSELEKAELISQLNIIQAEGIQELVINYTDFLYNAEETLEKMLFLFGYLCHHFLDAHLHPIINYLCGEASGSKHFLFENQLDAYFLKQEGIKPKNFKMYKMVASNKALSNDTRVIINESFKATYGFENIDRIFADYNNVTKGFLKYARYDPFGVKTLYAKIRLDRKMKDIKPSVLPFRFNGTELVGKLNEDRNFWANPANLCHISNQSLEDLYQEGVMEIARMITDLETAIMDRASANEIKSIVENRSSDTGLILKLK